MWRQKSTGCDGHLPPQLAGPEGAADAVRHAHEQNGEANVLGGDQGRRLLHNKRAAQRRCKQAHNAGGQRSRRRRQERLPCVELLHRVV